MGGEPRGATQAPTTRPTADGTASFVLSLRRLLLAYEVDYWLEASAEVQTWSPVAGEEAEPALNGERTVTATVKVGCPADPHARFFRLRVARQSGALSQCSGGSSERRGRM